ncbi:MAG: hypothetical protein A2534_02335 [Candidatus Magasanikbacteria bacterium RIFOXYD2_FULL_39_9]|uniref:ATP-grasp domain-containing protein n=1 Tax=Candidatus Magasanikbacteria bacterium RIFOXYD1_FULL_40_23 TaxID=1798705 RepID=A0A1F6PBL3_9BACT|nr:MAG: hypothetical protein A2534_02335 [Candidatus Magasanikbacteria bacterium RIFOXYD2_FULL_39_9]OGH93363.1 MAG: hypothetical protein A2563_02015 [Candidatus Magasanikbacteria bacterium RIFOXYD1_FULL_40_23]
MVNSTVVNKAISKRLIKHRLFFGRMREKKINFLFRMRVKNTKVFYVCRDIERAVGAGLDLNNYFIITNKSDLSQKLAKQTSNIIIINNKNQLNTAELLNHTETKKQIKPKDYVLVFKNNSIVEKICKENKWVLLNPKAELGEQIESKVSQVAWLGKLAKYLPPHKVDICQNIKWNNAPFVLQFNHSHTGSGIFFIKSKKELEKLQNKFARRPVRTMEYINGPVFTNNNVVWGNKTSMGNISYQITGLSPFTENKFTTIGNDWALPNKILDKKQIKQYKKIVTDIGKKLNNDGWKGLFGVDIIVNEKTGQLYLLEINARQPASTTFESQLQILQDETEESKTTTFEAHLAAVLGIKPTNTELITINNGAQIVQRVTSKITKLNKLTIKNPAIINILNYNNTALGADLARIQCTQSIMEKHNTLNALGKTISISIC